MQPVFIRRCRRADNRAVQLVTLKGHWLKETGFGTGTALEVKILPGCLILTAQEPQPEPPAEPEVVTTLRKACKKLSARKQRQIEEFIQVIATPQKRPRKIPDGMVEWRPV
ncbi:SymE family type I addiction module toxin [Erwinia wuhanensis]|uniref:SymE family type I addiction module toxin n=1 Tax=Erwinia wuhanensis TaxID=3045167 RepID=UPI00403F9E37